MNQEHRTVLSMIGWCHSSDRTTSWIYQVCVVVMFNVFTLGNLIKHLVFQITPYFTLELGVTQPYHPRSKISSRTIILSIVTFLKTSLCISLLCVPALVLCVLVLEGLDAFFTGKTLSD